MTHMYINTLRIYAVTKNIRKSKGHFLGNGGTSANPSYWLQTLYTAKWQSILVAAVFQWEIVQALYCLQIINLVDLFSICLGENGQERKERGGKGGD